MDNKFIVATNLNLTAGDGSSLHLFIGQHSSLGNFVSDRIETNILEINIKCQQVNKA